MAPSPTMTRKVMYTDTTVCTGCRACMVACKQWNQLPYEEPEWTGSYGNRSHFSDRSWRFVKFIEVDDSRPGRRGDVQWLMMSDVCKHCQQAGCLEACPTGAIHRTAWGTVDISQEVCNGCRDCVASCPFGVVSFNPATGRVNKCTFCSDRVPHGMPTACAKTCPTNAIRFGDREPMLEMARARVEELKTQGFAKARLYGDGDVLGGLNVFYVLVDSPGVYGLPEKPELPQRRVNFDSMLAIASSVVIGLGALVMFRDQGASTGSQR